MSEKPIIFSGPMVRAILDGAKTQDRRALKPQPWQNEAGLWVWPPPGAKVSKRTWRGFCQTAEADLPGWFDGLHKAAEALPYAPGDRLWVRETFCYSANGGYDAKPGFDMETGANSIWYRATDDGQCEGPWRPSIHMPRWASRINLFVTAVRVERLREISEADAIAEGCRPFFDHANLVMEPSPNGGSVPMAPLKGPLDAFAHLWDSINAKRPGCSWTINPWVAAISFEVMR